MKSRWWGGLYSTFGLHGQTTFWHYPYSEPIQCRTNPTLSPLSPSSPSPLRCMQGYGRGGGGVWGDGGLSIKASWITSSQRRWVLSFSPRSTQGIHWRYKKRPLDGFMNLCGLPSRPPPSRCPLYYEMHSPNAKDHEYYLQISLAPSPACIMPHLTGHPHSPYKPTLWRWRNYTRFKIREV